MHLTPSKTVCPSTLLLILCLCGTRIGCAEFTPRPLRKPVVVSSGKNGPSEWAMTMYANYHFVDNGKARFHSRAFCLEEDGSDCQFTGPTIEVYPGDLFNLTLINQLGPNNGSEGEMNSLHSPNTTNMHLHGLHVDPAVDSIYTKVEPGQSVTYCYEIPINHNPGTFWYHTHVHGASSVGVTGGLTGAFIVRPAPSLILPDAITQTPEVVLVTALLPVVQQTVNDAMTQSCGPKLKCIPELQPPGCTDKTAAYTTYVPMKMYTYTEISAESHSDMDYTVNITDDMDEHLIFINGGYQPIIQIPYNGTITLRFVGSSSAWMSFSLNGTAAPACSMQEIARDGVYLKEVQNVTDVYLLAGARVDVQLTCNFSSLENFSSWPRNETLITMRAHLPQLSYYTFGYLEPNKTMLGGTAVTTAELENITRPYYLHDLLNATVEKSLNLYVGQGDEKPFPNSCAEPNQWWMGMGKNCSMVMPWGEDQPIAENEECSMRFFQGERGLDLSAYENSLVTQLGEVNEWTYYGSGFDIVGQSHPMHLHVYHMQIVSFDCIPDRDDLCSPNEGNGDDDYINKWWNFIRVGEWRDTVPGLPGRVTVRFRPTDHAGEAVIHCHIIRHEDLGMMDTVLVQDCEDTSTGCRNECFQNSWLCDEDSTTTTTTTTTLNTTTTTLDTTTSTSTSTSTTSATTTTTTTMTTTTTNTPSRITVNLENFTAALPPAPPQPVGPIAAVAVTTAATTTTSTPPLVYGNGGSILTTSIFVWCAILALQLGSLGR